MHIIEDTAQKKDKHDIKHSHFDEMGVQIIRNKLPFGDYTLVPSISVDTKKDISEIAGNICGNAKEHKRFINECKRAKEAGCHLYFLIENECGINDLSQVNTWENPRMIYSPSCVQGARLQRAMETIQERYGCRFMFCHPEQSAGMIVAILRGDYDGRQD